MPNIKSFPAQEIRALVLSDLQALVPDCRVNITTDPIHDILLCIEHLPSRKSVTTAVSQYDFLLTSEEFSARIVAPMIASLKEALVVARARH